MRLVLRLTLALFVIVGVALLYDGAIRVRREIQIYESDNRADRKLVAATLAAALSAALKSEAPEEGERMIAAADALHERVGLRWVCSPKGRTPTPAGGICDDLAPLPRGQTLDRERTTSDGLVLSTTYANIFVADDWWGAVEVSEDSSAIFEFRRRATWDAVRTMMLIGTLFTVTAFGLGMWLVGRPTRQLVEKTRRIGQGDFSGPISLPPHNELGIIGAEINAMCDALARAREELAAETGARMAAMDQLRHAERLSTVGKLAAGVAHELGSPLNIVEARAGMLLESGGTAALRDTHAQAIITACERMTRIIRQLLDFSRPTRFDLQPSDLGLMSSRVFQLLEPLLRQKDLHWALHGREAAEARPVTVDPASFEQVLTNLVLNAIQACRHGGHIETHFEVIGRVAPKGVRADGTSWACLRIRDDGTGIPTEILPNIFEPFVTTKPLGEGTGLGLAVSFGIVRDHGGWIEARNTAPHGAEFSVFLPMSPTS